MMLNTKFFYFFLSLVLFVSFKVIATLPNIPPLPLATTNNSVATAFVDDQQFILSFMGLGAGKNYKDVHNKAWKLNVSELIANAAKNTNTQTTVDWQSIASVPSSLTYKGQLAAVAVGVNDSVYLFGGYTVITEKDNTDNLSNVYQYHLPSNEYTKLQPMPVEVNDAVAVTYRDRYIYLISGWHKGGAVNLVQVYDLVKNEWFQATPFAGSAVFGHAGGIVDNQIMICDGARVMPSRLKTITYAQETACYRGEISPQQPTNITWHTWFHPTDMGRFRMAAAGDIETGDIVFLGGSNNPHHFNGIGYNGVLSTPSNDVWKYNVDNKKWSVSKTKTPTMDHRSLIKVGEHWITIGGMYEQQKVTGDVITHTISPEQPTDRSHSKTTDNTTP